MNTLMNQEIQDICSTEGEGKRDNGCDYKEIGSKRNPRVFSFIQ